MKRILIASLLAIALSSTVYGASASAQQLTPYQQQMREQQAYANQQLRLQRQGAEFGLVGEALHLMLGGHRQQSTCPYGERPIVRYRHWYCPESQEYAGFGQTYGSVRVGTFPDGPGCTITRWIQNGRINTHRHCVAVHHREWQRHHEEHRESVARIDSPTSRPDSNRDNIPPDWQVNR